MSASLEPALGLLRCPECGAPLETADGAVACPTGHRFDLIAGRAPDLTRDVVQPTSLGQQAMRFRPLVRIYESVWRPLFTAAAGGTDQDAETATLLGWMGVEPDATILDVACGPGNTTRRLAAGVPQGTVVGVDLSVPMLEEAVARTPDDARVGFARVDAHRLPVPDDAVEAVHCAAALYLLADPGTVIAEIARVLRPGARFAGMTIASPLPAIGPGARGVRRAASGLTGLRYLGAEELGDLCAAAGLHGFRTTRRGAALLFVAEAPT